MRSWLFVPGCSEKMLGKLPSLSEPDIVIVDLEDGVAPQDKKTARRLVQEAIRAGTAQVPLFVRLNSLETDLTRLDIRSVVLPGVAGVMLPKAETATQLKSLDAMLCEAEEAVGLRPGALEVAAMIESPAGVLNADEIAFSPRVCALALGGEDLAAAMGAKRTRHAAELAYARGRLVVAAAAAGVRPIDTVWVDLADKDGLKNEAETVRDLGFAGKLAVHPGQIQTINEAFSPSAAEVESARRIVEVFTDAHTGVVSLEGKMVDEPVVKQARRVLALAEQAGRHMST